ncbi:MAG: PEP-CTERM sorting domain-containing protein [Ferruginibacter sp.]|nr:PEP-CTERM sorting domain-containing protein [Rhodoferax sp.]
MSPGTFLPGGGQYNTIAPHSSIISAGSVDVNIGAALGTTVYSGNYSYRVEDTTFGGYASAISQTVANYTDANIFFAWKAVLQNGGHSEDQSALMLITLHDDTANTDLISRIYNAGTGGGGVDSRFSSLSDYFYTPTWQIEQLPIDSALSGHTFTLSVLAADCQPTGHTGYVYLDGFGAVTPPPTSNVPEPASLALVGLGLAGLVASRRRHKSI